MKQVQQKIPTDTLEAHIAKMKVANNSGSLKQQFAKVVSEAAALNVENNNY